MPIRKNKKIKIIVTALVIAGIVTIGALAVSANDNNVNMVQTNEGNIIRTLQSAFKYVSARADSIFGSGKHQGLILFEPEETAEILGMTLDEFKAKLDEYEGNIIKVLEDGGKLGEYKEKVLANYKAVLDEQVAGGRMTQEQAEEKYAVAEAKIAGISGENAPSIHFGTDGERGEFKHRDGRFSEGFDLPGGDMVRGRFEFILPDGELPDGAETHAYKADGKNGGFGFGIGIGGIKEFFGSDGIDLADILGIAEEDLRDMIKEADGNIFKVLEDAGKLDEYKSAVLQSFKDKLSEQVDCGAITQEKADEAYEMLKKAVDNFCGEGWGVKAPGFGGHRRNFEDFTVESTPTQNQNYKSQQTANDTAI